MTPISFVTTGLDKFDQLTSNELSELSIALKDTPISGSLNMFLSEKYKHTTEFIANNKFLKIIFNDKYNSVSEIEIGECDSKKTLFKCNRFLSESFK